MRPRTWASRIGNCRRWTRDCAASYLCSVTNAPFQSLFYTQLGLTPGTPVVTAPDIAVGPFTGIRPYLYWTCEADTVQDPCQTTGPAPGFEWSFWFDNGFQGTDVLAHDMYVTAYFPGTRTSTTGPEIALVANAEGESPTIAPNTWVEIKGVNLAPAGDSRIWQGSDFAGNTMPTQLDQGQRNCKRQERVRVLRQSGAGQYPHAAGRDQRRGASGGHQQRNDDRGIHGAGAADFAVVLCVRRRTLCGCGTRGREPDRARHAVPGLEYARQARRDGRDLCERLWTRPACR